MVTTPAMASAHLRISGRAVKAASFSGASDSLLWLRFVRSRNIARFAGGVCQYPCGGASIFILKHFLRRAVLVMPSCLAALVIGRLQTKARISSQLNWSRIGSTGAPIS
jgi:hypothetical protein